MYTLSLLKALKYNGLINFFINLKFLLKKLNAKFKAIKNIRTPPLK